MLDIYINGEMFSLRTIIDFGADVNILNSKIVPTKYWVKSFRQVIGLGNKDLLYESLKLLFALKSIATN